jgi:endonuclease/exonuclease/phosphatase family metal-dependent hydrolase
MKSQPTASWRRRSLLAVVLAVVATLVPTGVAQGAEGGPKVTVMTRNLYLGTGLNAVVAAKTPTEFVGAVSQAWANVVATDFPARAEALADEIQQAGPDFVGLQEVSLWRDQVPSDAPIHPTPNAEHVVYDFLAILLAELAERGSPYVPVSTSVNADVEAPRADRNGLTDVRLTDRDVILVRAPLAGKVSNPRDGRYAAQLSMPSVGGDVAFTRGWTAVDYRHDAKTTVRIFNTHLEVEDPGKAAEVQVAQGDEALAIIAKSPYPVIALGDFNSAADGTGTETYERLTAKLTDAWTTARPGDPGLTCCQSERLDTVRTAGSRIDLVLTTERWPVTRVDRTGATPFRSGPGPLWASDHFGVTARITLQR